MIYKIANSRLVLPKYRSNYWKIVTCSYKLADRDPFKDYTCIHCIESDTHLHCFDTCRVALTGWIHIFSYFLESQSPPTLANIMELILGNFDRFPKFHPGLISVLVHCALWTTHTLFVHKLSCSLVQPQGPPNRVPDTLVLNILNDNIYKCLYTILVSYALPLKLTSPIRKSKLFKPVHFDKTKGSIAILSPYPPS